MQIAEIQIRNFKSIKQLTITDIQNALILVGQNNTGKTAILDAIRAVFGSYTISLRDFRDDLANVEIDVTMKLDGEDLHSLLRRGAVSSYRREEAWYKAFREAFPSFYPKESSTAEKSGEGKGNKESMGFHLQKVQGTLRFTLIANRDGRVRYFDGDRKNNPLIQEILPVIYDLDPQNDTTRLQEQILLQQENSALQGMRNGSCIFNEARRCNDCFSCIGLIEKKTPQELTPHETLRLLEYKLYQLNLDAFSKRVNEYYHANGGQEEICFSMNREVEKLLTVTTEYRNERSEILRPIASLGDGMRSIYVLSLMESCLTGTDRPGIILVEEPELFLHPKLQKVCGDILYRLAGGNQVIFSTHSPNLLPNFNSRQIRQVLLDADGFSSVRKDTDISRILNDLGYTANDLMNVDFVFIVEGKQDKSRLPLLLKKYYSETYDQDGRLSRVAIITTNSCTNIRTYANLKYMNQVYLKDNFLMIRDGDGKDPVSLKRSLCSYYAESGKRDVDGLPKVTERNVLILKYYSFENYFFDPKIMVKAGVVASEEAFYEKFLAKWKDYLCRLSSGKKLRAVLGKDLTTVEDVRMHMEEIRIHLRGHNLYDLFYGRFRKNETEVLERYIELAPKENFADIFEAIDRFIYFKNRK